MWFRRLVGIVMIVTCVGMVAIVVVGVFSPDNNVNAGLDVTTSAGKAAIAPPTVTLSVDPGSISAGKFSAIKWSTTSNPDSCTATGAWTGEKTAYGTESTGRLSAPGTFEYKMECKNNGGTASASISVNVVAANVTPSVSSTPQTSKSNASTTTTNYCSGRIPCYGPSGIAAHAAAGNCWGWNGDRVINISGFDIGFHKAKTGISTIEVSQICGHDLAPSLRGDVSAGGQTRDHNQSTKTNSDRNEIPYFVGYFDNAKP